MKQFTIALFLLLGAAEHILAQDFVTRGKIEYEVKFNNKRARTEYQDSDPTRYPEGPEFYISYRELLFVDGRWIYTPGRTGNGPSYNNNENSLYGQLGNRELVAKKQFLGEEYFLFGDSLPTLKWKLENETRKIAGWECRKAVARIQDSVYVVAFYCPEIIPQAGPELFTGLPGMILGVAIPRYYTTWFATKIELANIDESKIVPPTVKKGKKYEKKELAEVLLKKYKEAGWWPDVTLEKVMDNITGYTL